MLCGVVIVIVMILIVMIIVVGFLMIVFDSEIFLLIGFGFWWVV